MTTTTASTVWSPPTLDIVIAHMEATAEDAWNTEYVRSKDGTRDCFFGHLFSMGADDAESNRLWEWFENEWATTYVIYPVNDGTNPRYPQPTPRQRVIAYLYALRAGEELATMASMEAQYQAILAAERTMAGDRA